MYHLFAQLQKSFKILQKLCKSYNTRMYNVKRKDIYNIVFEKIYLSISLFV